MGAGRAFPHPRVGPDFAASKDQQPATTAGAREKAAPAAPSAAHERHALAAFSRGDGEDVYVVGAAGGQTSAVISPSSPRTQMLPCGLC